MEMKYMMLSTTAIAWAMLTAIGMSVAVRWILPAISSNDEGRRTNENPDKQQRTEARIGMIIGVCCATAAGSAMVFFGYGGVLTVVSILKIALCYAVLGIACLTDVKYHLIPNLCPLILIGGRLFLLPWEFYSYGTGAVQGLVRSLIVAVCCTGILTLFRIIGRGGIGFGDIKLLSALAFLCGARAVLGTLLFSTLLCLIASVFLLLRKKKGLKDYVPMGPFIILGFSLTISLGIG